MSMILVPLTATAAFTKGAKIAVRLADITNAEGTFTVLSAGMLTGAGDLAADSALVPFMYKATLAVSGNNVNVAISRKATGELGLNASEAAAFDPLSPVTFRFDRLETNPRFATIARPANAAVLVKLRIDMEDRGGRIELHVPELPEGSTAEVIVLEEQCAAVRAGGCAGARRYCPAASRGRATRQGCRQRRSV